MKYSKLKVNSICLIKYLKNKYCLLVNKDCLQIEREKKNKTFFILSNKNVYIS